MIDMNSGYNGYSMSKRAVEAYENGEKPFSKWTKAEIIEEIASFDSEKAELFKNVTISKIRIYCLKISSWHHTGKFCNRTNFYEIDQDYVEQMSKESILKLAEKEPRKKKIKEESQKIFGDFYFLTWGGTRRHPKATEKCFKNVYVVEKGCYYYVYDEKSNLLIKKLQSSNGTNFIKREGKK